MKKFLLSIAATTLLSTPSLAYDDLNSWMGDLEDNAFICQTSIPGAHDACSSNFSGWLAGIYKSTSQTQSLEVPAMLAKGVRLFDLRPCVSGSNLHINHGMASTNYDFDPVMKQLVDFVTANPTEFCVVVIRHETEGDSNSSKFGDMLQTSLSKIKDRLVDFRPNLTVGEARGKILFISRDEYTAPIYGGRTVDLADNRSNINDMLGGHCYGPETYKCSWWLQDHYEISDAKVKKQAIKDMLTKSSALAGTYTYTWVVNQTSGYQGSSSSAARYQDNAVSSNAYMNELLQSGDYKGPAGLVFMDYAGVDTYNNKNTLGETLTKTIIDHNFTYTMAKQGDVMKDGKNTYVLPKGRDMMWTAKYVRKEGPSQPGGEDGNAVNLLDGVTPPASNWNALDFDDSSWAEMRFPTASPNTNAPYFSNWNGTYNTLWIRKEFDVEWLVSNDTYTFLTYHDDDYEVYINGTKIDSENGWSTDFNNYRRVNIPTSCLRQGRNVLAVMVQQNWGGAYFDCGILRTEATSVPITLKNDDWHTFVAPGRNVNFTTSAVKAYKVVALHEGTVEYATVEPVNIVESGEAVLVRNANGAGTYRVPVTTLEGDTEGNILQPTTSPMLVEKENSIYVLANVGGEVAFHPVKAGTTVPGGKGFLYYSSSKPMRVRILMEGEEATAINGVDASQDETSNAAIYNIAGQRLLKPQRGLNIIGGKKIVK